MVSEDILRQATETLVAKFDPERVILFGSHARGTADPCSDVDLLVVCEIPGNRRALMVEMHRTLRGFEFARDILVLTPEEFARDRHISATVARPASQEGRILYERPRG